MPTPWRSPLARALHLNRSLVYARYLQLATVQANGHPSNRTVVFRGFLDATDQLKFVVDTRSEKVADIHHCDWGAVCWYFPKSREQFRLAGRLSLIDANYADAALQHARLRQWQELSESGRLQFAWAHPGKPRAAQATFSPPP
ncbi:MAG: pyridoxamine 5'-phosphate oxidase, partial [Leptolyngbyaceae cyanobacterium SL_7_1]|nr:pyridoxamine 5'-phosphate oxidase [Leptolyngbyaceae cyanobacterium SL_7_1]